MKWPYIISPAFICSLYKTQVHIQEIFWLDEEIVPDTVFKVFAVPMWLVN